jgi:type II secretory ATPase GspE/PulE/Tfp pilus assembly ATPase PilB-like protein
MGMDPFNFADALLGILAQRLAKRLCKCKEAYAPDYPELKSFIREYTQDLVNTTAWRANPADAEQELLNDWTDRYGQNGQLMLYRAKGCDTCRGTGYKGRVGLHELLIADEATRKLIQERARVADLFVACVEGGMRSLKMDGMEKVLMGLTDLKQVRSVCIK